MQKDELEKLYETMSLTEMAAHLGVAKSTLYYYMRKFNIERRSKSDAQKKHLEEVGHQRQGKTHTDETKDKISKSTQTFWDSKDGEKQRKKLGKIRKSEWKKSTSKQRSSIVNRLRSAPRPSAGELSKFGRKLASFLGEKEKVTTGIQLTRDHVSDIILSDHRIVIELLLPASVYGKDSEQKVSTRYDCIVNQLNDANYRVVIIEDRSNSISTARCERVYEQITKFFKSKKKRLTIIS